MLLPRLILTSSIEVYPATNDKFKKKFCYHKILANFHIKSSPPSSPLPRLHCIGRGSRNHVQSILSMHLTKFHQKNEKKKKRNGSLLTRIISTVPKVLFFKTTYLQNVYV